MLTDLDRIVVAVRERERRPVVRALERLLGAEVVSDGHFPLWAAQRTTLRAGAGEIELLSPKGVGAVANFIGRRGPGLFAIGFATAKLEKFRSHLEAQAMFFDENDVVGRVPPSDSGRHLEALKLRHARLRPDEDSGGLRQLDQHRQ